MRRYTGDGTALHLFLRKKPVCQRNLTKFQVDLLVFIQEIFYNKGIKSRNERKKNMLGENLMTLRKKYNYSQQELADMLSVSRQTISNWECGQGAPSLDKAKELAEIYNISLDDLAGNNVEIVTKERTKKDSHVLKSLVGRTVIMDCSDLDLLIDSANGGRMKVLEVNDEWIRVQYVRVKGNSLFKKENVVKLIELNAVNGFEVVEEEV